MGLFEISDKGAGSLVPEVRMATPITNSFTLLLTPHSKRADTMSSK